MQIKFTYQLHLFTLIKELPVRQLFNQIHHLGHRVRTVYAFGMVVLEILGTKIEDSGEYTCRATNKWGRAEISVQLDCVDKSMGQKPQFTTQIQVI
jgi:hypothetical protein